MHLAAVRWLRVSLINLMLVALMGTVMRYKIVFSLYWVDQKFLLHAHSHFAFAGWVTQALMALLVANLSRKKQENCFVRYRAPLYANLLTAYGMLLTFPVQGYGFASILCSTLSVFSFFWFAWCYIRDLNGLSANISSAWFKVALLAGMLSSAGPFTLAYMMVSKHIHEHWYLASVYFFLHFQYNGWFLFASMGLLADRLAQYSFRSVLLRKIFRAFALSLVPTLFLSLLWWPLPPWLYGVTVLGSFLQLAGWGLQLAALRRRLYMLNAKTERLAAILFGASAIAFTIKLMLQAASVIPSLSQLAFGFRPVVIGYLHLVLLGVITLFILGFAVAEGYLHVTPVARAGIFIFITGVIVNEILLLVQGVAGMSGVPVRYLPHLLFVAAVTLFAGITLINLPPMGGRRTEHNHPGH